MANQTAVNVVASIKRENSATPGVAAAGGAGAIQLRITDSPGLRKDRGAIQSNEHRADMIRPMGRLAGITVGGSYNAEVTIGGATDDLIEAIQRRVWSPALAVTAASTGMVAGATVTVANGALTSTFTLSAGDWIAAGFRVGDLVTPTGFAQGGTNNLRLRVVTLTALVMTVAGTAPVAAAAQAGWTMTRLKKITTLGTPTRYSYSIEQYDADVDYGELFLGCRLTGIAISFRPNANATIAYTFMGLDRQKILPAAAPYFTNPSLTVGLPLVADDSVIRAYGGDQVKFTGMDINIAIAAAGQPVIGSLTSPDIFDNDATITGSISGIREDFSRVDMFDAETEFDLSTTLIEPGTAPVNCLGIYVPRVKFSSMDAPFRGTEGPKIETANLMIGPRVAASGYDASALNFLSSAP